jgi:hypothetical protein
VGVAGCKVRSCQVRPGIDENQSPVISLSHASPDEDVIRSALSDLTSSQNVQNNIEMEIIKSFDLVKKGTRVKSTS